MMRVLVLLLILVHSVAYAGNVTVAVSANMQFAMQELEKRFTEITGDHVTRVTASSGKLTAQMMKGAQYDVFLSANMKYPETLYRANLTAGEPKIYAYGSLVLWSARGADLSGGLSGLTSARFRKIAVANPKFAPYGLQAEIALARLGVLDGIRSRLVYGESISQVNQYILSGAADVGITAKSVVFSPAARGKGVWVDVPSDLYSPVAQGAVLMKSGETNASAQAFYRFLFSPDAAGILTAYGYEVAE